MTNPVSLRRVVGLWGAVWMGLGSILGTGVFVSLGIATGVVGSGILFAVALAALVAMANGLSSAQLAAAHPVSGGTYEYGHTFIHPLAGFSAGWMFLAAKSASAATAALGCAGYFLHCFGFTDHMPYRVGLALALVLALTALVAGGLKRSNTANIFIVSLTIISLSIFVVFGWMSLDQPFSSRTGLASALVSKGWGEIESASALLHATALMFVAYTGYGRIATLGEEVRSPARTIPRAIITTLVVSMTLYITVCATAVAVVGAEAFAASTQAVAAPLEIVARTFSIPEVAWVVAVGAVTAMAGVLLNLLLGLSRVLLAMARRQEMPKALEQINDESSSPERAVWIIGALISGLVLLGDIKITWSFSAFTVLLYYGLTNLAALRLPHEARRYSRLISWFGLTSCLGLAVFIDPGMIVAGTIVLVGGFMVRIVMLRLRQIE